MDSRNPKVSVLMPVYNTKEEHLREAIDSILHQTFTDFEFLILNDASTDRNVERIIKSYDDDRIIYAVNDRNLGISDTRNRLIKMAKGEYLAVVDHNDISMPERFAEQVSWLDEHPETGIVSSMAKAISDDGTVQLLDVPERNEDIQKELFIRCCIRHPVCMIRKKVLVSWNVQYEKLYSPAEDYALFCRLIGKTEFYNLQKILLVYRNHQNNTSHLRQKEMANATKVIQNFAKRENPEYWDFTLFEIYRKHRFHLFDIIPLLKIEEYFDKKDYYLFGFIKILSYRKEPWKD